jgi:hypothetical protein
MPRRPLPEPFRETFLAQFADPANQRAADSEARAARRRLSLETQWYQAAEAPLRLQLLGAWRELMHLHTYLRNLRRSRLGQPLRHPRTRLRCLRVENQLAFLIEELNEILAELDQPTKPQEEIP